MAKTKHTPGPWKVIPERLQVDGTHIAGRCHKVVRDDATGVEVAWVYRNGDAHSIAAVPDLVKALKGAVARIERDVPDEADRDGLWVQMRAALAKAKEA